MKIILDSLNPFFYAVDDIKWYIGPTQVECTLKYISNNIMKSANGLLYQKLEAVKFRHAKVKTLEAQNPELS